MKMISLKLVINKVDSIKIYFSIFNMKEKIDGCFYIYSKNLIVCYDDKLEFITHNTNQLQSMFRRLKKKNMYAGYVLEFSIWNQKDMRELSSHDNIVVIDNLSKDKNIYTIPNDTKEDSIVCYTDASVDEDNGNSGICVITKLLNGKYILNKRKIYSKSSTEAELEAVKLALFINREEKKIRLVTDSMYVKKGLVDWIHNWKTNGYHTVNNEEVRSEGLWREVDELIKDKVIELLWVKGHRDCFGNVLCDLYAKDVKKS